MNKNRMELLSCGTKAKIGGIDGVVCAIEITYTNVLYKFGYFDRDMNYKTIWAHEKELVIETEEKQSIGFLTNKK